ncbi:hypothetical protein RSAG8_08173, partial [Rhizoctonia solani AG-8 WAC10335]
MGDDMVDSSKLDQLQSSQGESPSQQTLELADLYSDLAPPPVQWVDVFRVIAMLPEQHFLLRSVESMGEGNLCDQLPAILEAFTQVVTRAMGAWLDVKAYYIRMVTWIMRATGAWLDVKAVWRNTNTANSLCAYSTISAWAQQYQSEVDIQESVTCFVDMLCSGLGCASWTCCAAD